MPIIDFHNHLIPGVDDGAQSSDDSIEGVAAFVEHGVSALVATPHFDGGLSLYKQELDHRLAEIDAGWEKLTALCTARFPHLQLFRAVELLLDVPAPDLSDARLRINGGPFFLVEFPYMSVPPHSSRVLATLRQSGYLPILAHPERYHGLNDVEIAGAWRQAGAYLQVNGGSLLGRYGKRARQFAWELLERGWADFVCSDYHARGSPLILDYRTILLEAGGEEQAFTLMETNPARMLRGEVPLPVMPLRNAATSVWGRIRGLFR